jgi:multimeric flavodoxin WrbA
MKKVLIVAASPRKNGNSDLLAQQFAKGAEENGNRVEVIYLRDYKINYCMGCLSCQRTGLCLQKDDMFSFVSKMENADVICFASPVYYYSLAGQMKVFLDRLNPLFSRMKNKDFYYILTAQDNRKDWLDRAFDAFEGFADCFEDIRRKGRIYGGGATAKGEVKSLPAFQESYEMGKKV